MTYRLVQNRWQVLLMIAMALILLSGCTSRYRLTLIMTIDEQEKKVKIDETEYIVDADLGDPYGDHKLLEGHSSVLIVTTGTRGVRSRQSFNEIFGFDEYLVCRLYLQLPQPPQADTLDLAGTSFLQVMGRYELPPDTKIFLPVDAQCVIDSLTSHHLFATIGGRFENKDKAKIALNGRFKASLSR